MSYAMTAARSGNMGDPGLFGFLGNIGKSILKVGGGVVSGVLTGGLPGGLAGGLQAAGVVPSQRPTIKQATSTARMFPTAIQSRTPPPLALQSGSGVYVGPGGAAVGKYNMAPTSSAPSASGTAIATCGVAGHHLNKSGYFTHSGYVAPKSKCVRNRRRNPLNPRALSRAMSRVASAQKAVRCLQLFAGPAARASAKAGRRRSGKSCGGRCKR